MKKSLSLKPARKQNIKKKPRERNLPRIKTSLDVERLTLSDFYFKNLLTKNKVYDILKVQKGKEKTKMKGIIFEIISKIIIAISGIVDIIFFIADNYLR